MSKLLFIINPTAGGGKAKDLESCIREFISKYDLSYDIKFTTKAKEAIEIVEKSSHNKIIAVGGDGTVNEVAKGIINRGFGILGVIPGGTGNDFSRSIGIPLDPLKAIKLIINGETQEIDIGTVNQYPFLNISSFGFDAEVVNITEKIKTYMKSHIAYVLGVLFTLLRFKKKEVIIEIDGKKYKERLVLLAAGSGKYYGGGMKILPKANLSDGYLHLCLIKNINNIFMLFLFPTIFKGNHSKYKKYVSMYKAKNIKIKSKEDIYFNLDGEILEAGKTLDFGIYKKKLPIIINQKNPEKIQ